jgi:ATPase subunit of ABC transporter with duplicated ATPase domains
VDILERSTLRLLHGHRYGLVGRNGVGRSYLAYLRRTEAGIILNAHLSGKTTLLKRIARGSVPGFPQHLRVFLVRQEDVIGDLSRRALEVSSGIR